MPSRVVPVVSNTEEDSVPHQGNEGSEGSDSSQLCPRDPEAEDRLSPKPERTRVELSVDKAGDIHLVIHKRGVRGALPYCAVIGIITLPLCVVSLRAVCTPFVKGEDKMIVFVLLILNLAAVYAPLFINLPFAYYEERLTVSAETYKLVRDVLGWTSQISGRHEDISLRMRKWVVKGHHCGKRFEREEGCLVIWDGSSSHDLGANLSLAEQQGLLLELSALWRVPEGTNDSAV